MRVLQVVPNISAESAGPSYSVPAMCKGLQDSGCDVALHFAGEMPNRKFGFPAYAHKAHYFPHPNLGRSPEMFSALCKECKTAQIVHNNSLWMFPNVYPAWAKRGTECKLVTAPRGTLAAWALKHHWFQKKLFGWCAQNRTLRETDMWHATSEKEYDDIRARGYRQPVAIVPIGMDLPLLEPRLIRGEVRKKVVFFGRIHKVKAIDNLVLAWSRLEKQFPNWELVIAGPDCGMLAELKSIIAMQKLSRVSFVGELNGSDKYAFLASADIYVLPSYTENFAITVAEALACGTPVIASQGTPWAGLEHVSAGRWVPIGIDPLVAALTNMMAISDEERLQMGVRGREWISKDFSWQGIGLKMKMSYEWLLGKGDKPDCVVID